jgi:hypothetical protein
MLARRTFLALEPLIARGARWTTRPDGLGDQICLILLDVSDDRFELFVKLRLVLKNNIHHEFVALYPGVHGCCNLRWSQRADLDFVEKRSASDSVGSRTDLLPRCSPHCSVRSKHLRDICGILADWGK